MLLKWQIMLLPFILLMHFGMETKKYKASWILKSKIYLIVYFYLKDQFCPLLLLHLILTSIRCIFLSDPSIFHLFFWQEVDGLAPMMTSWKQWRFLKESSAKQTVRNIRLVFFPRHRALRSLPTIPTFSVLKAKSETSNCVKLFIDRSIYVFSPVLILSF